MTLPGHIFMAPDGVRGIDTTERITRGAATALHAHGYRFCVRYVRRDKPHTSALNTAEATTLLDSGLALMLVQYVESETAWIPSAAKGAANGNVAVAEAVKLEVPWGVTIWCDLEGVKVGTPRQQVIDYCNRWHIAVAGAGYVPGLYVGYRAGLTSSQLYLRLRFTHYWGAFNLNSDQFPAVRGVQMKQSIRRPEDAISGVQLDFQVDRVAADRLGGRPTLLALDGWPELP
ncbi:MAG TPA: glycoside hydrolase domain-containing protein [Gemmatimonadaceae bacterium]|nr:glycoside hydrolase domain-containing protein [Gemmatimonadaceae bacterium]